MNISEHKLFQDILIGSANQVKSDAFPAPDNQKTPVIAEIKVFTDISQARADWLEFEKTSIHTVFQTYTWLLAWHQHIGKKSGIEPQIIIGYSQDGAVQFLLPLAIRRCGPIRILCYLGCEEASYQFAQFSPAFISSLTLEQISDIRKHITALLPKFHVVRFKRQPYEWRGIKNPFASFTHKKAPSSGYAITLNADYETLYSATRSGKSRSKIVRRERKLAKLGEISYSHCAGKEETLRILDIMFAQKDKRFCEQGIANILERPGVQDFYRSLCLETKEDEAHPIELHYYKCDDQVLGVVMSAPYCNTEFGLINSMSGGSLGVFSPALHLLHRDIERLCGSPTEVYDLGVGAHSYKDRWADQEHPLFDTILPTSPRGIVYAYGSGFLLKAKRYIKNSKTLWPAFLKIRSCFISIFYTGNCPPVNETLASAPGLTQQID